MFPRARRCAATRFPPESIQLPHVPFHLVAPRPGGQTRCLSLLELFLRAPTCRPLGVKRCPLPGALFSPPLPVHLPDVAARAPCPCSGGLPRLPLRVTRLSLPHLTQRS